MEIIEDLEPKSLMPNYPKKQGKLFKLDLGKNEGPYRKNNLSS